MSTDKLPVQYESNNKAWMLTMLFEKWVKDLDKRMRAQNRKILLLLDNAPVHPDITLKVNLLHI
ncbi:hypothetical protein DPMN_193951 [Dreissena polymorpha]|uniref:DDE-1 domain-containing protein n=1 Tax=Dreissena polymorpha TaxID=45954 RepID=A0A9D3Y550_DREPO|nr:hypothetical protein DPMN_193951 [Dreissena polymorpha]